VRAQLSVGHEGGDLPSLLAGVFPAHDPTVLERMLVFGGTGAGWAPLIVFATETPDYRMVCWPNTAYELQVIVEPEAGSHKAVCQFVWDSLRSAMKDLNPTLNDLRIVDDATAKRVSSAKTSFGANLGRRDNLLLLLVGLASAGWVVLAVFTFGKDAKGDVIGAGVPGVLGGLVALLWAILDWWRGRLVWQG
jgi:hypothetical protein